MDSTTPAAEAETEAAGGRFGIVLIWVVALAGSLLVIGLAYSGQHQWFADSSPFAVYRALGVVFAVSVLGALLVQLTTRRPAGYVERASASVGGATVILALAALALTPLTLGVTG